MTTTNPTISDVQTATDACRELNLTGLAPGLAELCQTAIKRKLTYPTFLAEALTIELDIRHERRRARRVQEARLPRIKTLDEFDCTANPAVTAAVIGMLATGDYIDRSEPIVFLGNSGTGKSHLLIGACLAAAENGRRVRYVTCAQLANELVEAQDDHHLSRVVARYGRYELLAIDEIGYVHLDQRAAEPLTLPNLDRTRRTSVNRRRVQRPIQRMDQNVHRPSPRRRCHRPDHVPRSHHRDRHHQLPTQQPNPFISTS